VKFVDEVEILVSSGHGGAGCVSFRREKFIPLGGPNGGDGGKGGDVIIRATRRITTLLDLRYNKDNRARNGDPGSGRDKHGKSAADVVIPVPVGTLIKDAETGEVRDDLIEDGQTFFAAKGGRGGMGNAHFSSSTNRSPRYSQPGEEGEEFSLKLELKLLADVGIVGFPNAGKSTLISKISAAKPKIADYPFTTLIPNLGVVQYKDFKNFVVADIPGLIEGAHTGAGLGIRFLKHVERTSVFIHMLDVSGFTEREPLKDFDIINNELKEFNPQLAVNPQVVALNKVDVLPDREGLAEIEEVLSSRGYRVFCISAATGEGVGKLVDAVAEIYFSEKEKEETEDDSYE
jgi:GTP-binding protein